MLSTCKKLLITIFLTFIGHVGIAQALGLLDAYEAALHNDPVYRSAIHENEAGQEEAAIGRAGLLPNLSMTHVQSINRGRQIISATEATTTTAASPRTNDPLNFDSNVSTLSLRQPLLNMEAIATYRQGHARANSSQARFTGNSQLLVVRLVEAYVEALLTQDRFKLAKTQRDALEELKYVNEHMLQKGEGTTTDVLETQSRFSLAQAQIIEANDEMEIAQLRLEAIVGREIKQLNRLSDTFQIHAIQIPDYESWQALALERNAELVTQRHTVTSEQQEIKRSHAGHAPRVDLVASLSRNKAASFIVQNRDARFASIGVEVNIPIYSGGRVNAITRQARANHARAEADLDAMTDGVLVEIRTQHRLLQSSVQRIQSLELAVESAELLVHATQKSIQGGIRINLDLLDARQQLFTTQGDLAEARYNYLLAYLRLQFAAGTLVLDDLQKIAAYFTASN